MSRRFFAPDLSVPSGDYLLEDSEAHHLRTVCRCKEGDTVELFDGQGTRAVGTVRSIERRSVHILLQERHSSPDESTLTIACAMPKGDRAGWLVEKCTELGARKIIPLKSTRSVTDPKEGKKQRWQRTVIEACKQCGRDWLMQVDAVTDWPELCGASVSGMKLLLDSSGEALPPFPGEATVAIGPEGGWTAEELQSAREHGWQIVSLPGHVLRIETCVITMAAWARVCSQGIHRS